MMRGVSLFAMGAALAAPVAAAPLSVRVVDSSGRPVRDAVVTVQPAGALPKSPRAGRFVVAQKSLKFVPFVSIIPVGSQVSFPNLDPTKHHVYSFSAAKRFELKLFARDQSRTVHFDKRGVVALGCNIHDGMTAFIVVTDSPWVAKTNAQGVATLADAPAARGKLTVWHPYLRAPGNVVAQGFAPAQRHAAFSVRLRPPPMAMSGY